MAAIAKLLKAGKVLLVVSLISIFLNYFGLKSWERFKNQKVLVTKSWEKPDFLPTPSITVCSLSAASGVAFKNVSREMGKSATTAEKNILEYICKGLEGEQLIECVERNVFDLASIVQFEGYSRSIAIDQNTPKDDHWKMNFDYAKGPCYTFQNNQTMGNITNSKIGLKIGLNETMKQLIFVHDPRYFIKSKNPDIPVNEDVLEPGGSYSIMSIKVVEHRNLDVPNKRCNPEEKYSLTDCVRETFSNEVGCTLHWAQTDFLAGLPICTSIDQHRLGFHAKQSLVQSSFNCQKLFHIQSY